GLVLGVGFVIAIAVLFYRKDLPAQPAAATSILPAGPALVETESPALPALPSPGAGVPLLR
ncbi:MAG: AI-2E family transporter, partial [Acidobacteria bacterium]|nr:AI-2E family transporter [Acidobacteriota bacterium]